MILQSFKHKDAKSVILISNELVRNDFLTITLKFTDCFHPLFRLAGISESVILKCA